MRLALNCPKCGTSVAANLPDRTLPAGWLIHQAVTCGRCGRVLNFEDGGAPAAVDAITAWVFTLNGSRSGVLVGAAVVCLEARSASVKVIGQLRISTCDFWAISCPVTGLLNRRVRNAKCGSQFG
jgi:ribosomal protein S27E